MTEFNFFSNRAEGWTKDLSNLWGNISICPHLNLLELPGHSPTDLISGFKVWGDIQNPCHDLAYLLVHIGNTKEEIQLWGVPSLGEPLSGQDSHHGGGSQEISGLHLQWQ